MNNFWHTWVLLWLGVFIGALWSANTAADHFAKAGVPVRVKVGWMPLHLALLGFIGYLVTK